jgi:cytochrome c551/c552
VKKAIISFVIFAVIGFGLGYFVFEVIMGDSGSQNATQTQTKDTASTKNQRADTSKVAPATVSANQDNILSKRGCLGCHSVSALNLKGGQVGPDLSHAFVEVKDKHGIPIEQFLTKPNSAVMSGVLGNKPLTNDQRKQVLAILKKASETK